MPTDQAKFELLRERIDELEEALREIRDRRPDESIDNPEKALRKLNRENWKTATEALEE